ncbi:MAG: tRNA (N(6)-L-threonylcarbamoyladenosine(37)-C(2))-methylthiotransferase MtaB [Candidatus Midichloria sp.]|uniref:tRNA (N(6)-L-threonylcarbamoyladenosine(37)-C(2))-methylthiotransferase MtaB n=1 Tax=Hyalomma marginatum TaxID=34627 RepID=A0A8S4C409_9ACAR|nr:tRNA (N(6)-L-threonylcarbamoyladenosine(37)-C(2))-methylthiotransferase MtaB [Hyalomma marginatum]CAG7594415.1 tRNA (N(6)-L-threonylcarbamoyladenosine(37)-C(2))-methylthiotransferase MtaB [Hyalomma marginatum]
MTVEVITFGCRLNQNEGVEVKKRAEEAGLKNVIILNSCSVTSEAERQLRQSIRKLHRKEPNKKIIVTGCAAQVNPVLYSAMPEVDKVIGNIEKMQPQTYESLLYNNSEKILVNDIMSVRETAHYIPDIIEERVRAFLQIQNGCNHSCTFCIIPYGRGNSRSVPLGEIVANAQNLVDRGFKEIVLTGVDITDYGLDLPGQPSLTEIIKRLLNNVSNLPRLRLSSIDVAELKSDFIDLFAHEKRIMPHLHLSLQSGDNMILKRMKRRHSREDIIRFCSKVRSLRPETEFGADIIAGFPTETQDMFQNTVNLLREIGISYLHVFPYSERHGTPAARMPQVPKNIRKERAAIIRQVGAEILRQSNANKIGKTFKVLVESDGATGRAEDFSLVKIASKGRATGEIATCLIKGIEDEHLIGAREENSTKLF